MRERLEVAQDLGDPDEVVSHALRLLLSGEREEARALLETLLRAQATSAHSWELERYRRSHYVTSLIALLPSAERGDWIQQTRPFHTLEQADNTPQHYVDYALALFDQVAARLEVLREQRATGSDLSERVDRYVEANINDPNLSVASVGTAMQLTSSYLSRLYREERQYSILDRINQLRVQQAKALLAGSQATLQEIAERIGYSNVNTFIRIFKRMRNAS